VKYTKAFHSSSVEVEVGTVVYTGMPGGILLTIGEKTIYHLGDTSLYSDLKLIVDTNDIDLAFILIGATFTMGSEVALIAADWVKADYDVPVHYNTFPVIEQNPKDFTDKLKTGKGLPLQAGEEITL